MTERGGTPEFRPIVWQGEHLLLLDQTALPQAERWVTCRTAEDVAAAIKEMRVRGAPAIGITAAAGVALAARQAWHDGHDVDEAIDAAVAMLRQTRPTAVNLAWALERAQAVARVQPDPATKVQALAALVDQLLAEQWASDETIARAGAALLPRGARVLTHCNTGGLATGALGTALGIIRWGYQQGVVAHVYVDESRPWLQGARLTAWELGRAGVPYTLIADAAAASFITSGQVDAIIVGADRVAANGDVANKIGTLGLAIIAAYAGVPFYVAAPCSSFDLHVPDGSAIPIEQRSPDEVRRVGGVLVAPPDAPAANPAFDVTPAKLITALVTDVGVISPPTPDRIAAAVAAGGPSHSRLRAEEEMRA